MGLRNPQFNPNPGPPTPRKVLPGFPHLQQKGNNLCWAACVQMVTRYYGLGPFRQCEMAEFLVSPTRCCPDPVANPCDVTCHETRICTVLNRFRIASCNFQAQPATFTHIQKEIHDERPVLVGLRGPSIGHALVVSGWKLVNGAPYVRIHDPLDSAAKWDFYDNVRKSPQYGPWTWSWTDIRS